MDVFHDWRCSKYEPLSPTVGCLSKTATARDTCTYRILPVDACYWEKKCDDTLSTCSSAYSTIQTTLSTKSDELLPEVLDPASYGGNSEPPDAACTHSDSIPDPPCRGNGVIRNPAADGTVDERAAACRCPEIKAASGELPPYPGIVQDLQVRSPATMTGARMCQGRVNVVGADVKNISVKRLYLLNTILSTMLILCCLAAILYLVFYMFERTDT